MKEYRHYADSSPADLPGEAAMALRCGSLEKMVVSIVPPCRAMNPHEIDLADSGVFFPLEAFFGLKPDNSAIRGLPKEIAIYRYLSEGPDKVSRLRCYNW